MKRKDRKLSSASIIILLTILLVVLFEFILNISLYNKHTGLSVSDFGLSDYGLADWAGPTTSDYASYTHRQNITIDFTKMTVNTTNYTTKIVIQDSTNPLFTNTQSNGFDIGFTDTSGNKLQSRRLFFNASNYTAIYLAKLPTISNATNTILHMYYGNPTATDQSNSSNDILNTDTNPNITTGLLLDYTFDTNISDITGNNRALTGTLANCVKPDNNRTFAYKLKKDSCDTDGFRYDTTTAEKTMFNTTRGYTMSMWDNINRSGNNGQEETLMETQMLPDGYIQISTHPSIDSWYLTCYNGSSAVDGGGVSVAGVYGDNTWRHFAMSVEWYENLTLQVKWYRDGVLKRTSNCNNIGFYYFAPNIMVVGAHNGNGVLNASVDDVQIWNRTLTSTEIANIYTLGKVDDRNFQLSAEETAPNVSLTYPLNGSSLSAGRVDFNFTPTAGSNTLNNCTLYTNASGTFSSNTTITSPTNNTNTNITVNMVPGTYTWNVQCFDTAGFNTFASVNRTFTVTEATPPTWSNNLTTGSSSTISTDTVYFNITPTDANPDKYIFSFNNGSGIFVNDTSTSWTSGVTISINKTSFITTGGTLQWYWTFNDTFGNTNQTSTFSFTKFSEINSCGTINNDSVLTANVSTTTTCFTMNASGVTLDCKGYTITGDAGISDYGITVGEFNNTNVQNCPVIMFGKGFYITTGSSNTIQYNSFTSNGTPLYQTGVYVIGATANNNTIKNNNFTSSVNSGEGVIIATAGNGTNITGNKITTSGIRGYGVDTANTGSLFVSNNIISTTGALGWGLYLQSDNIVIDNNTITVSSVGGVNDGIQLINLAHATLTNNRINASGGNGIMMAGTTVDDLNHTIDETNLIYGKPLKYLFNNQNTVLQNNNSYGEIIVAYSNNITLNNISISSADGIQFYNTTNSTIVNSSITSAKSQMISLRPGSKNNIIHNNTMTTSSSYASAIILSGGATATMGNNITSNSITISGTGTWALGIYLSGALTNNLVKGNIITTTATGGRNYMVQLDSGASNNTFDSNVLSGTGGWNLGFLISEGSSYNNITNNSIKTTGSAGFGVYLYGPSYNNSFSFNTINVSASDANGLYLFRDIDGTSFDRDILNVPSANDIYFLADANGANGTLRFINVSFNRSDIGFASGSVPIKINVSWYVNTNITDQNGAGLNNSNITVYDVNNALGSSTFTDSSGTSRLNLLEYTQNQSQTYPKNVTYYTPHTINVSLSGYSTNSTTVNLTSTGSTTISLSITETIPPTVTINSPTSGWYNSNFIVNATVTDASSLFAVKYRYENSSTNGSWTGMSNPSGNSWNATFDITSVVDGNYSFRINATDNPRNENSTVTVTNINIDDTIPSNISFVSPTPSNGSVQSSSSYTVNFTFTEVNPNNCIFDNSTSNTTMTMIGSLGTNSCIIPLSSQSDGVKNYKVYINDTAGNIASSETRILTIDTKNPALFLTSPSNNVYTSSPTINFTINSTDNTLGNITLYIDGIANETNTSGTNGTYIFTKTLAEGTHNWSAISYDVAGNNNQSETRIITIDATPPTILDTILNASTGRSGDRFTISINTSDTGIGVNTTLALLRYEKNTSGTSFSTTLAGGLYTTTWNSANYPNGTYIIGAQANDSLGNQRSKTNEKIITLSSSTTTTFSNTSATLITGTPTIFNATGNTMISIQSLTNITNASILIATYNANTENNTPTNAISLNKTIHVTLDTITNENIGTAFLNITYNETLATTLGIDESTLRIYNFNTSTNNWTALPLTGVDTTNNAVWANVTHFSIYGLFGNATASESGGSDNGSSGSGSSSSGGGSAGGSSGSVASSSKKYNYSLSTERISVKVVKGENSNINFFIKNNANSTQEFDIIFSDISDFIFSKNNTHFKISPGEEENVTITIVGLQDKSAGIYSGKILVNNGREEKSIDIMIELNVRSALFDVKTSILPRFKKIGAGQTIPVSTELFNFGNVGKADVYVTYTVINSSGTKILEEKESIAIETTTSTLKEIHLPDSLSAGTYTVFVIVKYNSDEEASSSVQFEVVPSAELQTTTSQNIFGSAIGITKPVVFVPFVFVAMLIVAILLYYAPKRRKI